eukprot:716154_1
MSVYRRERILPPPGVQIAPEIEDALQKKFPVIALESTIISHGMPYPRNFETGQEVEKVVRANGAIPATIAIIDGVIKVGLTASEMEHLAKVGLSSSKCSRRDIAAIVSSKGTGSTTVAATMFIAHMVGIRLFVTGGIGGVHRGAENTMDISADLTELGRTPVAVVCAGVKSILDIPKTLEVLETEGVPVVAVGQKNFPAFYLPDSGCPASTQLNTPTECAKLIHSSNSLSMANGILFGAPIPEQFASDANKIEAAITQALEEAREKNIHGRDITPFMLLRIAEITGGKSLDTNIALVKNNAAVGAKIAVELSRL